MAASAGLRRGRWNCGSTRRLAASRILVSVRKTTTRSRSVAFTEEFYTRFDAAAPQAAPAWIGGSHLPLFPTSDYHQHRNYWPFIMMRRGEIAIFTASELADASLPDVPWPNLAYPAGSRTAARGNPNCRHGSSIRTGRIRSVERSTATAPWSCTTLT